MVVAVLTLAVSVLVIRGGVGENMFDFGFRDR